MAPASEAGPPSGKKPGNQGVENRAAQRVERAQLRAQTLELRARGMSYPTIAATLGLPMTTVYRWVQSALRNMVREPAAAVLTLELSRLDTAQEAIWPAVERGYLPAIDRLLRIMERRARLLGLDAPVAFDVRHIVEQISGDLGLTPEQIEATVADVEALLAGVRRV